MGNDFFAEKRSTERFSVRFSVFLTTADSVNAPAFTRDICSEGLGVETKLAVAVGNLIDIFLEMPQSQERFYYQGKVVWAKELAPGNFQLGIHLEKQNLRPIPLLLKEINYRLQQRSHQDSSVN